MLVEHDRSEERYHRFVDKHDEGDRFLFVYIYIPGTFCLFVFFVCLFAVFVVLGASRPLLALTPSRRAVPLWGIKQNT